MAQSKLTARTMATAKTGRYGDGRGLWLVVAQSGARKWVFRFTWQGKVTEMGLGGADVTLAESRDRATHARKLVATGVNPIEARRADRLAQQGCKTFWDCATALHTSKRTEWRSPKHAGQWLASVEQHAKSLHAVPVDEVDTAAVLGALQPIWKAMPETASRLRGRIEATLDYAKAHGLRSGDNPARWRGHLALILPRRGKLAKVHHAAMPYGGVPAFLARLRERPAMAATALEFAILTAARSGEVLGARWAEIDLETRVWTIPAARMKSAKEHRVPLSHRATAIVKTLAEAKRGEFIFAGQRPGKPLSGMALEMILRRMKIKATPHGFRSSFRDWAGDATHFPRELAEAALAHVAGDATEQAYRRSDALDKRRALMEAWAQYCEARREIECGADHQSRAMN
jgi:integrase